MNKKMIRAAAPVLAVLMGLSVPAAVQAASPSFAHSAEEWARLQDNKIEYDELKDLIHEYNVTVQNNVYELQKFKREYGDTNDEVSRKYYDLAQDTFNEMNGEDIGSDLSREMRADNYMKQATDTLDDSRIQMLGYEQTEMNLVKSAQTAMISLCRLALQKETTAAAITSAETALQKAELKKSAGMATELDVLNAKQALENAQSAVGTAERSYETQREKLNVMLGWQPGDTPELGELPVPDTAEIEAMDPERDLEAALTNNYVLRTNERKLENAKDETTRSNLRIKIEDNRKKIGTTLQQSYRNVLNAKLSFDKAAASAALAEQNLKMAELKASAGMMTQNDLDTQRISTEQSRADILTAQYALLEAVEGYRWAVNGLAAAE